MADKKSIRRSLILAQTFRKITGFAGGNDTVSRWVASTGMYTRFSGLPIDDYQILCILIMTLGGSVCSGWISWNFLCLYKGFPDSKFCKPGN
jgi:hypothetical protein